MRSRPERGTWPSRTSGWLPVGVVVGVLVAWEGLVRAGVMPAVLFSTPTQVVATLFASVKEGEMVTHTVATVMRMIPGLLIGGVPGMLLGLAMGWSPKLRRAVDPILMAVHPIPKIAILPLIMMFLGIGEASRVAVVAIAAFFPMLINTMAGVRQINPIYFEVAKNYGASRWKVFTRVVVPGSIPMAMSGLRLAANVTLLVTIAVEIVAADTGLGALVWVAWETLRVEVLYATLVVISLLGIGMSSGLERMHHALVPWGRGPRARAADG